MARKRPHHGNRRRGQGKVARRRRATREGTLRVYGKSSASVETAEGTFAVARNGIREAMNGDVVEVSLVPMRGTGKDPVAYVQRVIDRATQTILGTFDVLDPLGVVRPLDTRLTHDFFVVPEDDSPARLEVSVGDVVSARIMEYPTRGTAGVVTLERRVGSPSDVDLAVEGVIASWGLRTHFPDQALVEAGALVADVEAALEREPLRQDLRGEFCLTVDPADARDFDDAVGARRSEDGFEVSVHIADVTHYVAFDGSIDLEARARTCSVYLVDRVIPMLPEVLCNDICSLVPDRDRLAMTVRVSLDRRGRVTCARACPSAIRSRARLAYEEADAILEGALPPERLDANAAVAVQDCLRILDEVATLRREVRRKRGAIDFETQETKVVLDDEGHPTGVSVRRRTRATSLIEEAMLLANESVAKMISDAGVRTCYRVHEAPSPEDLLACVPALSELGLLDAASAERLVSGDAHATQDVLKRAEGTRGAYVANALLLRAQKRAIYLDENLGHYALGADAYCHFTSPIRRYPDVDVHRALKACLGVLGDGRQRSAREKILSHVAHACSAQERVADGAARDSQKVKMAELYQGRIGERESGVIVGCTSHGLFVMADETLAEGFVSIRSLGDEWYTFDEKRLRLTGESSGRTYSLGQRVAIEVTATDVARGRIDFTLARSRQKS